MSEPSIPKTHKRIIDADGRTIFVVVPADEYELLSRSADTARDIPPATLGSQPISGFGVQSRSGVPVEVAHRVADGENPVRVWREWRGLKAITIARSAGISPAYLSEIETGKKDGTFRTMAAIARVLNVSLDDLAPAADEDGLRLRKRRALEEGVRGQVCKLVDLVTGPVDFNTAAVRYTATMIASDVATLQANDTTGEPWLKDVLNGIQAVLDLVDSAEGDIIATAGLARQALEDIVRRSGFMPAAELAGHGDPIDAATPRNSATMAT